MTAAKRLSRRPVELSEKEMPVIPRLTPRQPPETGGRLGQKICCRSIHREARRERFPENISANPASKIHGEESYQKRDTPMSETKKNILIIDDDITALDIVSFLVEQRGFNVERCADGFAAIDTAGRQPPDLILVDLMMPNINGIETVSELRQRGITAPIIAFTAVDEPTLHQEAERAGCNKVLTKPCRPDKLIQHIKTLLDAQPA